MNFLRRLLAVVAAAIGVGMALRRSSRTRHSSRRGSAAAKDEFSHGLSASDNGGTKQAGHEACTRSDSTQIAGLERTVDEAVEAIAVATRPPAVGSVAKAASQERAKMSTARLGNDAIPNAELPTKAPDTTVVPTEAADTTVVRAEAADTTPAPAEAADATRVPTAAADATHVPTAAAGATHVPTAAADTTHVPTEAADTTLVPAAGRDTKPVPEEAAGTTPVAAEAADTTVVPSEAADTTVVPAKAGDSTVVAAEVADTTFVSAEAVAPSLDVTDSTGQSSKAPSAPSNVSAAPSENGKPPIAVQIETVENRAEDPQSQPTEPGAQSENRTSQRREATRHLKTQRLSSLGEKLQRQRRRRSSSNVLARIASRQARSIPVFDEAMFAIGTNTWACDRDYVLWNQALADYFWSVPSDACISMPVSPNTLEAVAVYADIESEGHDAESSFVAAVAAMYHKLVESPDGGLEVFLGCDTSGKPACLSFIALSILAAYDMSAEDGLDAKNYYRRLSERLGFPPNSEYLPKFDRASFETLWHFLDQWSFKTYGTHIAMPSGEYRGLPYVGLPLTHVPLRRVDVQRLPQFFEWAKYEPHSVVGLEVLSHDVSLWARPPRGFTRSGSRALEDARRSVVLEQIGVELRNWDGTVVGEAATFTSVMPEIRLDFVRGRPLLFWVVKRAQQVPDYIKTTDGREFVSSDGEYFDEFPLGPGDGADLLNGFEWIDAAGGRFSIRRPPTAVLPFGPYESCGLISRRGLLLNVRNSVLAHESVADAVRSYLQEVTGQDCLALNAGTPLTSWLLFPNVVPIKEAACVPDVLIALSIVHSVEIDVSRGLRGWNNAGWLIEALPTVTISGLRSETPVLLDGQPVALNSYGEVQGASAILSEPRAHTISAGSVSRRLNTVEPFYRSDITRAPNTSQQKALKTYVLPKGDWIIVGSVAGQVARPRYSFPNAVVAFVDFEAAWAVSASRPPFRAILLSETPPRWTARRTKALRTWSELIYRAHLRRASIESEVSTITPEKRDALWLTYYKVARQCKRQLKRRGAE